MIDPDEREMLWYDVMNILNMDSDRLPHYFTTLFDKFKLLFGNEKLKNYCLDCLKSNTILKDKDGYYCKNEDKDEHELIKTTPNELLDYLIKEIQLMCQETNGNIMDLYDIELYIYRCGLSSYFETKKGLVTKSEILKQMYIIRKFIINELIELRGKIKFTSYQIPAMKTQQEMI